MSGLLHDLLMSIGFTRRILVSREQRRLDLEKRKQDLKTEFAFYCQDGEDGKQFYTANPDKFAEVKAFGIDKDCALGDFSLEPVDEEKINAFIKLAIKASEE